MIRRLAAAAVAPLALTTLVACGGDGDDTASDPGGTTSSSSASPTEEVDAPAEGEEMATEDFMTLFEGAFEEASTARMRMEMESAGGEMTAEGEVDYTGEPPALELVMGGQMLQGQQIEARMVDGIFYMKMPAMGEKFLRVDLNDPNNPLGPQLTDQLDPKATFEGFAESIQKVVYEGSDDVDGDPTEVYEVTVDAAAVLEKSGQAENLPPGFELPEQITYEVHLDEDGLFRRMETDMGEQLGEVTVDMTDWGTDVSIEAPPKDQVTDFPGAGGTSGGVAG